MKIGIMGAMPEEVSRIICVLENKSVHMAGNREFYEGTFVGIPVVVAFSRWGKVAAAATAMQMISAFGVDKLLFTGVAGAISHDLHVGDIIVGRRFYQHDMDASPLYPRYEIPLTGVSFYETDLKDIAAAYKAAQSFLSEDSEEKNQIVKMLGRTPNLVIGDIASGDRFVASLQLREAIRANLPDVSCVEMEGAAVAQVCHDWGIPFLVVRAISDSSDESSKIDFPYFVREIVSTYSFYLTQNIITSLVM